MTSPYPSRPAGTLPFPLPFWEREGEGQGGVR
jgi:hypothetical protein